MLLKVAGVLVSCVVLSTSLTAQAEAPSMQLTVSVVGEDGVPIEGAMVKGLFTDHRIDYEPQPESKALSDEQGRARISGPAIVYAKVDVTKDGYYLTQTEAVASQGRKQEVTVVLREKRNPIAMYAKRAIVKIPERGREFGFDFFEGDLVGQGHSGRRADMTVRFDRDLTDIDAFTQTMKMKFAKPADGFVRAVQDDNWKDSEYRSDYLAPSSGYQNSLVAVKAASQGKVHTENMKVPLYLRIRSRTDSAGNVKSAYYCKVWPGIKLLGVMIEKPLLEMTYYCNPTENDRNVEFDVGKNLFEKLKPVERVQQP
jgi:hypothetical protein